MTFAENWPLSEIINVFVNMARLRGMPGTTSVSVEDIHRMVDSKGEIPGSGGKMED